MRVVTLPPCFHALFRKDVYAFANGFMCMESRIMIGEELRNAQGPSLPAHTERFLERRVILSQKTADGNCRSFCERRMHRQRSFILTLQMLDLQIKPLSCGVINQFVLRASGDNLKALTSAVAVRNARRLAELRPREIYRVAEAYHAGKAAHTRNVSRCADRHSAECAVRGDAAHFVGSALPRAPTHPANQRGTIRQQHHVSGRTVRRPTMSFVLIGFDPYRGRRVAGKAIRRETQVGH